MHVLIIKRKEFLCTAYEAYFKIFLIHCCCVIVVTIYRFSSLISSLSRSLACSYMPTE